MVTRRSLSNEINPSRFRSPIAWLTRLREAPTSSAISPWGRRRVINVPPRGIGDKTMVALQLQAQKFQKSAGQIVIELANRMCRSSVFLLKERRSPFFLRTVALG